MTNYEFVCFLLGNSQTSESYMPTFRNSLFRLHKQIGTYLPMKIERSSEMSVYKIPGNYTEESIKHSQHGEGLKSRKICVASMCNFKHAVIASSLVFSNNLNNTFCTFSQVWRYEAPFFLSSGLA